MEINRCAECVWRVHRPLQTRSTTIRHFAKRQRVTSQARSFTTTTTAQDADRPSSTARGTEEPSPTVNVRSLFDNSVQIKGKKVAQKFPVRREPKLSSASSLEALLGAFKSKPLPDSMGSTVVPIRPLELKPAPFKLGPVLGRTIHIDESRGRDVGAAFRQLAAMARKNSIAQEFRAQRFHERPGLKRKRLASQRHRKRFKEAFQETLQRVQSMRKMGW